MSAEPQPINPETRRFEGKFDWPVLMPLILEEISSGGSVRSALGPHGITFPAFYRQLELRPEWKAQYEAAQVTSAEIRVDNMQEAADQVRSGEMDFRAGRVYIDAQERIAKMKAPKRYNERVMTVENKVTLGISDQLARALERVAVPALSAPVIDAVAEEV